MAFSTNYYLDPNCVAKCAEGYRTNELATLTYTDEKSGQQNCVVICVGESLSHAEREGQVINRDLRNVVTAINSVVSELLGMKNIAALNRSRALVVTLKSFCSKVQELVDKENEGVKEHVFTLALDKIMRLSTRGVVRFSVPNVTIPTDEQIHDVLRKIE